MANANDYNVHDLTVQDQPFFTPSGAVQKQVRVQFFVGSHGPFVRTYTPSEATTEKIQSDINAQVQQLRILGEIGQAS